MIKSFSEITMKDVAICGGKGASLGEMMNARLPIPNGFVLTTKAYGKNSKDREKQVLEAFDKLDTKFVAVRSSGTKEDGVDDSFAGQFDTYLFVTRENLIKKIKECHDSVNSERIVSYCEYKGIDIKSIKVAVVVQKMVNSESAGVCFTVNPVSENPDEIMIDAGFGVGEAVVSGMITPDNYIVNKKTLEIKKLISQQEKKLVLSDKGGTKEVKIPKKEQENQKLSDKHIKELAELAKKIEKHYGKPMDTEWAIENGELFMLQARPITTLGDKSEIKRYTIYPAGDFNTSFISNYSVVLGYTKFPKLLGLPICDGPHVVRNGDLEYIFDMSTWDACGKTIVEKMDNDINYIDNLIDKMMSEGKNLCERIKKKSQESNLKKLKNEELLEILEEFIKYQSNIYAYGTSLNFIGYGEDNYITKNLINIFNEKHIPKSKIGEVMEIFTYPYKESFSQQQEIEILELLNKYTNKYKKDFVNDCKNKELEYIQTKYSDFFEELKSHSKKYSRLSFGFTGPASDISDFFADVKKLVDDKISVGDRLEAIKNKRIANEKDKKIWMEKLCPNKNEKLLLETAGKIVWAKPTRKDYQSQAYCLLEPVVMEISNRLKIDTSTVWQMSISNMRKFLKGKYDSKLQTEFQKFYICVPKNPEKVEVLTGDKAHEFYDDNVLIEKDKIEVQDGVINGNTACKGSARGIVKIINSKEDMKKMETGNILVSVATSPSIVAAMKKAAGIITDSGGLTCHAAIVSRELGIPCVIGTKIATQVLKDGDLVEVDANNGIVKVLENEDNNLEVKIGNKTFTPEFRSHPEVYFNYQAYPFFTSIFAKCYAHKETKRTTPCFYISEFSRDNNRAIQYVTGSFIEKGNNMIEDLLSGGTDASKLLEKKDKAILKCFNECRKYLKDKNQSFSEIWDKIGTAFSGGWHIFNLSHALQEYLNKLKIEDSNLFEAISTNIIAPKKSFVNQAEDYLIELYKKYPKNFDKVYEMFMDEYGRFQNSYLGVNKNITKSRLKAYYTKIKGKKDAIKKEKTKKIPENYKKLVKTASNATCYQDNKKKLGAIAYIIMEEWLNDISKKTKIHYNDLLWLTVDEILSYDLKSKTDIKNLKEKISKYKNDNKRRGIMTDKGYIDIDENFRLEVVKLNNKGIDGNIIHGVIGNKGKITGRARIVLNIEKDAEKINEGDILVTGMTRPEFVPIMRKAGAFITDEGGVTCHAAIISRELGKPCIIGTKIATQVLKDGDLVEVDANNGIVKVLENEDNNLEVKIGNKTFTPEFRQHENTIHFSYQGVPFFSCIFSKCCTTNDTERTTPANYVCQFNNLETATQYVIGDFVEKGENMIETMIKGKKDASIFLKKQDETVLKCIKKCDKYIRDGKTNFLDIRNEIKLAFEAGCHVINLSYALQKYLENLNKTNQKLYKNISENINAPKKSFVNEAGDYLKKLMQKYPDNFEKIYNEFMIKYGWFQNSYLGIKHIDKKRLKEYAEELSKTPTSKASKKKTKIEKKYSQLVETASNAIIYQDNKKRLGFMSMQIMENRLRNYSKKIKIPYNDLLWLTVEEIIENDEKTIKNKINEYKQTGKRICIMTEKGYTDIPEEFWLKVTELNKPQNNIKSFKGITGCKGKYTGNVKIISNIEKDRNKFKKGDILVTGMTRPEFVPLIKKAGGIITNEGGITCHAAIISRELGIPCIIGTKIATQVLKDGDLVEVDADNGIVKILGNDNEELTEEKKKIIDEFIKRKNWYDSNNPDAVFHFSYPGKVFYIHFPYYFYDDFKKEWGGDISVVFSYIINGKAHLFMSIYDGFISKMIEKFEKKGLNRIKKKVEEIKHSLKKIENDKVLEGQELSYYCNKINTSFALLRDFCAFNQIAPSLDPYITKKLESLGVSKKEVMKYGVDEENGAMAIYKKNVNEFLQWAHKNNINLSDDYKILIKNKDFENKLMGCYKNGYFFHSGYSGVTMRSPEKEFGKIRGTKISKEQQKTFNVKWTKEQEKRLKISQYFSYHRDFRKEVQQKVFYYQAEILEKIAKILGISRDDLEYLQPDEYNTEFFSNIENVKKTIEERKQGYMFIVTTKGKFFLDGSNANNIYAKIFQKDNTEKIAEIHGNTAYKGKYKGNVRIVFDTQKENDFNEGDILVTGMTTPEFVPIIKKSGAIITDAGGVTCHAAIISREFQKPCIVGTKIATQVLKDGDLVEVDADNGIVKIL